MEIQKKLSNAPAAPYNTNNLLNFANKRSLSNAWLLEQQNPSSVVFLCGMKHFFFPSAISDSVLCSGSSELDMPSFKYNAMGQVSDSTHFSFFAHVSMDKYKVCKKK